MSRTITGSFVQPQPSESVESILLRLCRASGLSSPEELVLETLTACQRRELRHRSTKSAAAVAQILSIPFDDVVRRHTLLPLILSLNFKDESCHQFDFARNGSFGVQTKTLRICPQCASEDLHWHGYSFYRRDHQIIGVNVCHKHGEPLLRLKKGAELYLPSDPEIKDFVQGTCPSDELCPLSYKFRETVVGLLEREQPICSAQLGNSLRGLIQAELQEAVTSQTSVQKLIEKRSDEDQSYISDLLEDASGDASRHPIRKLRFTLYGAELSPLFYALVTLLITDSVHKALNILLGKEVVQPKTYPKTTVPTQKLVDAYLRSGGSFSAVQAEVGLNRSSVIERFKRMGWPNLARKKTKWREAFKRLSDGASLQQAATQSGVATDDLQEIVVKLALDRVRLLSAPPPRA